MNKGINIRLSGLGPNEASLVMTCLSQALVDELKGVSWNITNDRESLVHTQMVKDPPGIMRIIILEPEQKRVSIMASIKGIIEKKFDEWVKAGVRSSITVDAHQCNYFKLFAPASPNFSPATAA